MNTQREESVIFNELADLCTSPGYAHVIAYFCYRDNTCFINEQMKPENIQEQHRQESLIRNEISTLTGLLVKKAINLTMPTQDSIESMINQTEVLLRELHDSLSQPMRSHLNHVRSEQNANSINLGQVLREPIFYGGDSAYYFQHLEFSIKKYASDDDWLKNNMGFSIFDAKEVVYHIIELQRIKLQSHLGSLKEAHPENFTMLPAFIFTLDELMERTGIEPKIISNILSAFCMPVKNSNETFTTLSELNCTNYCPLILVKEHHYILFQHYNLSESLYESPFYWMVADKKYVDKANINRGAFVEKFSAEKIKQVFGSKRVLLNLDIYDPERPNTGKRGEIDILIIFGNRAIILQSKAKRLTLEARKGNDLAIRKDFAASIQDSYNQGFLCAELLNKPEYILVDQNSNIVNISRQFTEIYVFCVIPDHYPALNIQVNQFLTWEKVDNIQPPFVMDIFFLDVLTEMVTSPLYFLSYVSRRTSHIEKIFAPHEITILSFFMKNNFWLEETQFITLQDDVSSDIDSAMIVRRLHIPGKATPDGALSRLEKGRLGKILKMMERSEDSVAIDLGFLILTLDIETIEYVEQTIEKILQKVKQQDANDLSISIREKETGITIHFNKRSHYEAMGDLRQHCELRKYIEKANSWYGLCVNLDNGILKFVIKCNSPWVYSSDMEIRAMKHLMQQKNKKISGAKKNKIGANQPCPCGSGLKYKKCCRK